MGPLYTYIKVYMYLLMIPWGYDGPIFIFHELDSSSSIQAVRQQQLCKPAYNSELWL